MTALTDLPVIQASKFMELCQFKEKVSQGWFFFKKKIQDKGEKKFPMLIIKAAIKNL